MNEAITKRRLENYTDMCQTLAELIKKKQSLEKRYGDLSAVSYDKTKVMAGNGHRTSEEERNAIFLERINNEILKLRVKIQPEHDIIVEHISRLSSSRKRTIITLKYIEQYSTTNMIEYFFCDDPLWNPEGDLTEFKKTQEYDNYRRKYLLWQSSAIKELESISGHSFVPEQNQLRLI